MKRNQGFTLIELIIVIVILGILAVTAAPKFLNFGTDAKRSTLSGVKGALESAGALVYGKAVIAGVQSTASVTSSTTPVTPVTGVDLVYGYPAASVAAIRAAAELSSAEWQVTTGTAIAGTTPAVTAADIVITPVGTTLAVAAATTACHVVYAAATSSAKPVITVDSSGC